MTLLKTTSMKRIFLILLAACTLSCTAPVTVSAFAPAPTPAFQDPDDPFGSDDDDDSDLDQSNTAGNAAEPPPIDRSLSEGNQLIIRSLRSSNPTTPTQLARAIRTMMAIKQFDEAKRYLNQLINSGATSKQLFEVYQLMGADFFWELSTNPNMQPEGRQYARAISGLVEKEAFNPARIDQLIKQLSDDNVDTRSEAFQELRILGAPAAAGMLDTMNDPSRDAEFGNIKGALRSMDDNALFPLLAAARADGTAAQLAAVNALGNYSSDLAVDTLYRVFLSSRLPGPTRAEATRSLRNRLGNLPTYEEAQSHLYRRACQYLNQKQKFDFDASREVTFWVWDGQSKKFASRKMLGKTALRIVGSDLAHDLYRLNPSIVNHRRIYLISILESQKRLVGSDRRIGFENLRRSMPDLSISEVDYALGSAMKLDLIPAATGAAETLAEVGTADLLTTRNSNLVKALAFGQRHVQFAAFQAIAVIDPKVAFPGSSYATKMAVYLSGSSGTPTTVVGHNNGGVAQTQASAYGSSGLTGISATTSRELFETAISDPDIEMIFVTDTLDYPHYQELVQQLRSDWRTKRTPIGLLINNQDRTFRSELTLQTDKFLQVMPLTDNEEQLFGQVQRLRELLAPWAVSNSQRIKHKEFANEWLSRILLNRQQYRFYDVLEYRDKIVDNLRSGGFSGRSKVLATLGTPASQRALADIASESSMPIDQRRNAADAFGDSIQNFGTLLSTVEIQRQYDRYNASESQPKESQEILASILNVVEAKAKLSK